MTRSRRLPKPHLILCVASSMAALLCWGCTSPPEDNERSAIPRTTLSDAGSKLDRVERGGMSTSRLHDLLDIDDRVPLEASGVALAMDGEAGQEGWGVAFDNFTALGMLPRGLERGELLVDEESDTGYEGLTFDSRAGLYYAVVEGVEKKKRVEPEVHVYDTSWKLVTTQQVDFELEDVNKGIEGLAHVSHEDELYLFMLCESNRCERDGEPGEGRIYVFVLDDEEWEEVDRVKLPESLRFKDYSGLDIRGDRIVVSSQEDSAVWLGRLVLEVDKNGEPDWKTDEDGQIFELPKRSGKTVFCNVEGVSFDSTRSDRLVLVSDRHKPDQSKHCEAGDESFHLIALP